MCITRYYQRQKCGRGDHKWSWTSEERVLGSDGRCTRHMCARCSTWSNWIPSGRVVGWRAKNGLLDMKTFYPEAWAAQRMSKIAAWAVWVVLAGAFPALYWWQNAYATGLCLILSMACWVLSSAAKADVERLTAEKPAM